MMVASAAQAKLTTGAGRTWGITAVLFSAWVTALIDRMIIIMLVPGIKASLHLSDTQVSLLYGLAFSIFFAVAGLPAGRIVDVTNRRNLLMLGVVGWSLGAIACGLASSFTGLFAARLVVGVSQAVLAPATLSMVNDYSPPESRGRTTSLLVSGASVGAALSSMLGGVVLELFTTHPELRLPFAGGLAPWQSTFIVAALPGLLVALALLAVPEPQRIGKTEGAKFKFLSFFGENRATFAPLYAAFALTFIPSYGMSAWYPVLFMRNLHMPPHVAGLLVGTTTLVCAFIAAGAGGFLSDRFAKRDPAGGRLKLIRLTMLLTAVSQIPLLFVNQPALVVAAFAAFATLSTITVSIAYTVLPELVPNEGRGQMIAILQLIGYLVGLGVAPTAIALVTDRVFGDEMKVNLSMLIVCAPVLLLAVVMVSIALPAARRLREAALAGR
jgi:MFS family permease